jgi:CHAD domain-containing protein
MPVDQDPSRVAFRKLSRQLTKLTKKPAPENVHKFRTYSRRVEALLDELVPKLSRSDKKLLKQLARLRKKAGRVRDLDVQITALRSLKIPQEPGRKSQLMRTLSEERAQREKTLPENFDQKTVSQLRKRLNRAASEVAIPESTDLLSLGMRGVLQLGRERAPLTEKTLHQYRIVGKRARYIAELARHDPKAAQVVTQLKRMQDMIGDWHDWLKLTQRAQELFGGVRESALVAALQNVTRAKFREAVAALAEARMALSEKAPVSVPALPRRKPQQAHAGRAQAAVA